MNPTIIMATDVQILTMFELVLLATPKEPKNNPDFIEIIELAYGKNPRPVCAIIVGLLKCAIVVFCM
jgi:hypothetical protein